MNTSVGGSARVLVIGASSGLGAAFAGAALNEGAMVTVSARRSERLLEVVGGHETGHAVVGDATVPADMLRVASEAAEHMGGIDLMLYSAGFGVLQPLLRTDPDVWSEVYRVNVIGANLAAAACMDHMTPAGAMAFVSSRTTADVNAMFAAYTASKAALDQCIRTWRIEHPDRRFIRITMGNTQPTEFHNHMGVDQIGDAIVAWEAQAIPFDLMDVDDVACAMWRALSNVLSHPDVDQPEMRFDARITEG